MAAYELLSDQGLRLDGRKSGELRRIRCNMGVFGQADGSAYIEQVCLSFEFDASVKSYVQNTDNAWNKNGFVGDPILIPIPSGQHQSAGGRLRSKGSEESRRRRPVRGRRRELPVQYGSLQARNSMHNQIATRY